MLNQLFKDMYNKNIQIEIKEKNKLNLKYEHGLLNQDLKEKIKENKKLLIKRLKENEAAKEKGFIVYEFGMFYEYRYGYGSFLFIERNEDDTASSWRANYAVGEKIPYRIKYLKKDVSFEEAFREAANFVNWLNKKRRFA